MFRQGNTDKKIKSCIYFLIIISFTLPPVSKAQDIFFGIKTGVVFSKVSSINKIYDAAQSSGYPKNSYDPGLLFGVFGKLKIDNNIALVSELYVLNYFAQITLTTTIEAILEKHYKASYIRLPFLLRYQIDWIAKPYVDFGLDFGYLLKAEHKEYDLFDNIDNGKFDITNDLTKLDLSFNFGLGMEVELFEQKIFFHTNLLLGLTKYQYSITDRLPYEPEFLLSWRNNSLLLVLGTYF